MEGLRAADEWKGAGLQLVLAAGAGCQQCWDASASSRQRNASPAPPVVRVLQWGGQAERAPIRRHAVDGDHLVLVVLQGKPRSWQAQGGKPSCSSDSCCSWMPLAWKRRPNSCPPIPPTPAHPSRWLSSPRPAALPPSQGQRLAAGAWMSQLWLSAAAHQGGHGVVCGVCDVERSNRDRRVRHLCQPRPGRLKQLPMQVQRAALGDYQRLHRSRTARQGGPCTERFKRMWVQGMARRHSGAANQSPCSRTAASLRAVEPHLVNGVHSRNLAEREGEARSEAAVGATGAQSARHFNGAHVQCHVLFSKDELGSSVGAWEGGVCESNGWGERGMQRARHACRALDALGLIPAPRQGSRCGCSTHLRARWDDDLAVGGASLQHARRQEHLGVGRKGDGAGGLRRRRAAAQRRVRCQQDGFHSLDAANLRSTLGGCTR